MQVNIFESTANGYAGRARYFGINEALVLVALDPSDADNAPDYRIHLDDEDGRAEDMPGIHKGGADSFYNLNGVIIFDRLKVPGYFFGIFERVERLHRRQSLFGAFFIGVGNIRFLDMPRISQH